MNKIGVLLINLGTPKSPSNRDVFTYLNEFLTDARVIDFSWLKRQLLVRGVIVPARYRQSAEQYRFLWTDRGSPLMVHSLDLKDKLQKSLGSSYHVTLAMRYQIPSIENGLKELKEQNVTHIIILPLFPQYASATTGSTLQRVMEVMSQWETIPKMTMINSYPTTPKMIEAFCDQARKYNLPQYDHFIFSFHGLPERQIRKADRYGCCLNEGCCKKINKENEHCYKAQCHSTAHAIANSLELDPSYYTICFQSRLGKEPWLEPYTSDVIREAPKKGYKNVLVFSPAFVCDCLETTFEIGHEYAKEFRDHGGQELSLVEGLNSHPKWVEALADLVRAEER